MHTLLCMIKNHVVSNNLVLEAHFVEYDKLGISPVHVHRAKGEHKRAIFLLGKLLASFINPRELSNPAQVASRFGALAANRERVIDRL